MKFSVRAHTKSSELLMVVGGCSELGNWEVKNGVKLAKNGEKVNGCVIFLNVLVQRINLLSTCVFM